MTSLITFPVAADGGLAFENPAYPARVAGAAGHCVHATTDHFPGRAHSAGRRRGADLSGFAACRSGHRGTTHTRRTAAGARRFVAGIQSAGHGQGSTAGHAGRSSTGSRTNSTHASQACGARSSGIRRPQLRVAARLARVTPADVRRRPEAAAAGRSGNVRRRRWVESDREAKSNLLQTRQTGRQPPSTHLRLLPKPCCSRRAVRCGSVCWGFFCCGGDRDWANDCSSSA